MSLSAISFADDLLQMAVDLSCSHSSNKLLDTLIVQSIQILWTQKGISYMKIYKISKPFSTVNEEKIKDR